MPSCLDIKCLGLSTDSLAVYGDYISTVVGRKAEIISACSFVMFLLTRASIPLEYNMFLDCLIIAVDDFELDRDIPNVLKHYGIVSIL